MVLSGLTVLVLPDPGLCGDRPGVALFDSLSLGVFLVGAFLVPPPLDGPSSGFRGLVGVVLTGSLLFGAVFCGPRSRGFRVSTVVLFGASRPGPRTGVLLEDLTAPVLRAP